MEPLSYWQQTQIPADQPLSSILPSEAEVVVVGGGLLGIATTYWLARMGCPVVLLEQDALAAGASGRNGGIVGTGPAEPYSRAIAHLGEESARTVLEITRTNRLLLHQVLAEEKLVCDYREPGHLHLALTPEELAKGVELSQSLQQAGIQAICLDRAELQKYSTCDLGPDISGGLLLPENGLLHSVQFLQGLGSAARRYGARTIKARVRSCQANGQQVHLETSLGAIRADSLLIALNAWTDTLLPDLAGVITPVRGQVLAYAALPPVFSCGMGAALTVTGEYWQQTPAGVIVLGGCRAAAPGYDRGVRSNVPTAEVQSALEQIFPRLFPDLAERLQVLQRWAGSMAFTADQLPVVDRVSTLPNTWVAGGFCGHGMPFGLRIGQLVAEAIVQGHHPEPLLPLRLARPTLATS